MAGNPVNLNTKEFLASGKSGTKARPTEAGALPDVEIGEGRKHCIAGHSFLSRKAACAYQDICAKVSAWGVRPEVSSFAPGGPDNGYGGSISVCPVVMAEAVPGYGTTPSAAMVPMTIAVVPVRQVIEEFRKGAADHAT